MHVNVLKPTPQSIAQKTFVIEHENTIWLQAYDKMICKYEKDTKKLEISKSWTQSKTTRCYLLAFLNQYGILLCKTEKDLLSASVDGRLSIVNEIE